MYHVVAAVDVSVQVSLIAPRFCESHSATLSTSRKR
jgi:hypothetical protein